MNSLFSDHEGNGSSMNLVWLISIFTIMSTWILLSLKLNELQHVTGGDALWFTSLFSGQVLQSFAEKKLPSKTTTKRGILENSEGNISPARILWIVCVLGIIFTWVWITWKNSAMQHFSAGDAAWFTALFGSKVGGTVVERSDMNYGGDGDSDEGGDYIRSASSSTTDSSKDTLISQLQETVKVQSEFNKNLVDKIDPKKEV